MVLCFLFCVWCRLHQSCWLGPNFTSAVSKQRDVILVGLPVKTLSNGRKRLTFCLQLDGAKNGLPTNGGCYGRCWTSLEVIFQSTWNIEGYSEHLCLRCIINEHCVNIWWSVGRTSSVSTQFLGGLVKKWCEKLPKKVRMKLLASLPNLYVLLQFFFNLK